MPNAIGARTVVSDALKQRVLSTAVCFSLAAFFLLSLACPAADLDMWHEIGLIRESIGAGRILTEDPYAYTPTLNPAVDHEWGAGVFLYALGLGLGGWAIVVWKYALSAAALWLALSCARSRGATFAGLAALAPLAIFLFGLSSSTLRAHSYSLLFTAVLLRLLDSRGRAWVLLWGALFVLWANIHGGCVIGIFLMGAHWLEQILRGRPHAHVLAALALSFCAIRINPFGTAYYRHLWSTLWMPRPEITEWWPIWRFSPYYTALFALAAAVAAYAFMARGARPGKGALLLAATALGSLAHVRVVPFFALAWLAYVPGTLAATRAGQALEALFRRRELVTAAALALSLFTCGLLPGSGFWKLTAPPQQYPTGAVRYLAEQRFRGNVMTPFTTGAYVSWRLYPAIKVSMDSRYDIAYPPKLVDESFRFYRAQPGWRDTLSRYDTRLVLAPRTAGISAVLGEVGWTPIYRDGWFELWARPGLRLPIVERREVAGDRFP